MLAAAADGVVADDDLPRRCGFRQCRVQILWKETYNSYSIYSHILPDLREFIREIKIYLNEIFNVRGERSHLPPVVLGVVPVLLDERRRVNKEEVRDAFNQRKIDPTLRLLVMIVI